MFANTLTLTIDGVAKTLLRINQDNRGSEYQMVSGTEKISMVVRHSVDKLVTGSVNRHNMYVEWTVFATPTVSEKYFSATYTLREREGSDPVVLDKLSVGILALAATLDSGLVVGEN